MNLFDLPAYVLAQSQTGKEGMITIEVVTKPTFWDYVQKYFYIPAIIILVAIIVYRKLKLK